MVGSRAFAMGLAVTALVLLENRRASACSIALPPPVLAGMPAAGELGVPTDVVPVFSLFDAGLLDSSFFPQATFEFTSATGEAVDFAAQMTFATHFELIPNTELEPSTEYTIRATFPPRSGEQANIELSLSFTTGSGPLTELPAPPDVKMQHYHADTYGTTCDPGTDGSCLFFPPGTAVAITDAGGSSAGPRLTFDAWWDNLSGVNQGTPFTCATLRARAIDGTLSDPVDVCRDDAEIINLPSSSGLRCTENGITSTPPTGTGGTSGTGGSDPGGSTSTGGSSGTSGSDAGGTSAGGASTGGTGAAGNAGAPDDDDSRTVVTEGCGCRVPGSADGSPSPAWLALVASLAVTIARRRRSISR